MCVNDSVVAWSARPFKTGSISRIATEVRFKPARSQDEITNTYRQKYGRA